jgi:DNA-binding MarR family transcriptional regulator
MPNHSEPAMIGDVTAILNRSADVFPDVAPSTVALWLLATRAGRMTEAFTREVLAEHDTEDTEFSILVFLLLSSGPHRTTMGDLASAVVLSQPGTTRALQRSERNGTIRKLADPTDGRSVVIELTTKGRKVVETTMRVLFERFDERLGAGFSTAQALTVASANAGYALALDAEPGPSRGPASRSESDWESRR